MNLKKMYKDFIEDMPFKIYIDKYNNKVIILDNEYFKNISRFN